MADCRNMILDLYKRTLFIKKEEKTKLMDSSPAVAVKIQVVDALSRSFSIF